MGSVVTSGLDNIFTSERMVESTLKLYGNLLLENKNDILTKTIQKNRCKL